MSEIELTLNPSKAFLKLSIAVSILMMIAISYCGIDIPLKFKIVIGILIILINVGYSYWHLFYAPFSIKKCYKVDENNEWVLKTHQGEEHAAKLEGNSLITPFLIILNFKRTDKKRISVLIFKDSLSKEIFRELRVLLRFRRQRTVSED